MYISFHFIVDYFMNFHESFERTVEESFSIEHTRSRLVILVSFCISLMLLFWYRCSPHQHPQMAQGGWHTAAAAVQHQHPSGHQQQHLAPPPAPAGR